MGSGKSFQYGDANLDGVVDVADFNIWNENKFTASDGAASGMLLRTEVQLDYERPWANSDKKNEHEEAIAGIWGQGNASIEQDREVPPV